MNAPNPAISALVRRAAGTIFEPQGAMLLAAAAAAAPEAATTQFSDPANAFLVACGAANAGSRQDDDVRDRLERAAFAVPDADRLWVLSVAERLIARVDATWAWSLIDRLVGAGPALAHAIGLDVAAQAERTGAVPWEPGAEAPPVVSRQLAADRAARAAVAGHRSNHGPMHALRLDPTGANLLPSEARVLLAGAAGLDPAFAVETGTALLANFVPADLQEAFRLVADAAVRAGIGDAVLDRARTDGFVAEQATWAAAAAAAGAVTGQPLLELLDGLAQRVDDELDPGRELVAGLPILEAFAHAGAVGSLIDRAVHWQAPASLVIDRLFFAEAAGAAAALAQHPAFDEFVARRADAALYSAQYDWWPAEASEDEAAATDPEDVAREDVAREALAVVAAAPLRPLPGSLADIVGWPDPARASVNGPMPS
ncbi:hypothetical protein WDJ51_02890 [Rathayibacter sp. YIM 133350]|uniref:hypothetical protein n=1 Tax=Rathayibacter sp. YIM 133350 TaxID=3131992 RepID=UPI00307EFFE5